MLERGSSRRRSTPSRSARRSSWALVCGLILVTVGVVYLWETTAVRPVAPTARPEGPQPDGGTAEAATSSSSPEEATRRQASSEASAPLVSIGVEERSKPSVRRVVITGRLVFEDGTPAAVGMDPWIRRNGRGVQDVRLPRVRSDADGSFEVRLETEAEEARLELGGEDAGVASSTIRVVLPVALEGGGVASVDLGEQPVVRGGSLELHVANGSLARNLVNTGWRLRLFRSSSRQATATATYLSVDQPARIQDDGRIVFDGLALGCCYRIEAPRGCLASPGFVEVTSASQTLEVVAHDREKAQPVYVRFRTESGSPAMEWVALQWSMGAESFCEMVPTYGQIQRFDLPAHVDAIGGRWSILEQDGERPVSVVEMQKGGAWSLLLAR